jgi:hypothetical protein
MDYHFFLWKHLLIHSLGEQLSKTKNNQVAEKDSILFFTTHKSVAIITNIWSLEWVIYMWVVVWMNAKWSFDSDNGVPNTDCCFQLKLSIQYHHFGSRLLSGLNLIDPRHTKMDTSRSKSEDCHIYQAKHKQTGSKSKNNKSYIILPPFLNIRCFGRLKKPTKICYMMEQR